MPISAPLSNYIFKATARKMGSPCAANRASYSVNQTALDFHHKSEWMPKIAELRTKYRLKLKVEKEKRVNECLKMGFKRVILPAKNMKACAKFADKIELVPVNGCKRTCGPSARRGRQRTL